MNGVLYGTTSLDGSSGCYYHNGCGTVFSVTERGAERVLYRFKGGSDAAYPNASLIYVNGKLYGTTMIGGFANQGTFYSITTAGVEKVLHRFGHGSDGSEPAAGLLNVNGMLYGTTEGGFGTVYSISTTGSEKVLYKFTGRPDGANPEASLINVKGVLYGTAFNGGRGTGVGNGTVFALTP